LTGSIQSHRHQLWKKFVWPTAMVSGRFLVTIPAADGARAAFRRGFESARCHWLFGQNLPVG